MNTDEDFDSDSNEVFRDAPNSAQSSIINKEKLETKETKETKLLKPEEDISDKTESSKEEFETEETKKPDNMAKTELECKNEIPHEEAKISKSDESTSDKLHKTEVLLEPVRVVKNDKVDLDLEKAKISSNEKTNSTPLESSSEAKKAAHRAKHNLTEIKTKKEEVLKQLDELKSQINNSQKDSDTNSEDGSYDEDKFADILESAFDTSLSGDLDNNSNLENVSQFLQEHKKIDEKLVNTKQSKLFLIKKKTIKVKKSSSSPHLHQTFSRTSQADSQGGLYDLDNTSRATLPNKLMRKISVRKGVSPGPKSSTGAGSDLQETLISQNSRTTAESIEGDHPGNASFGSDEEVITYKKVFKDNVEVDEKDLTKSKKSMSTIPLITEEDEEDADETQDNLETFQFQFKFSKIKLDTDQLKFDESIENIVNEKKLSEEQDIKDEEEKTTTLISNSNGKVITTTIKNKGNKTLFTGLGISSGFANLYSSIFGWRRGT